MTTYDVADDGYTNTASFLGTTYPATEPLSFCRLGTDYFLAMLHSGNVEVWAYISGTRTVYTIGAIGTSTGADIRNGSNFGDQAIRLRSDGTDVWLVYYTQGVQTNPYGAGTWTPWMLTVSVWNGSGFTLLGTDAAASNNNNHDGGANVGFVGQLVAAASPDEPGALHAMWSECGPTKIAGRGIGGQDAVQRVSYSKWDNAGLVSQADAYNITDAAPYDGNFSTPVLTQHLFLTNASGSPVAFYGAPSSMNTAGVGTIAYGDTLEMWDMTTVTLGSPVVLQTASGSSFDAVITGLTNVSAHRVPGGSRFSDGTGITYVSVPWAKGAGELVLTVAVPEDGATAFTFPDSSSTIGHGFNLGQELVDDGANIWLGSGGSIGQYHRNCPAFEIWQAHPVATIGGNLVEMEIEGDTIYTVGREIGSAGTGNFGPLSLPILRDFSTCGSGLRVWQRLS